MKIVLRIDIDTPTQDPYWIADVTEVRDGRDEIIMQVVSKTFNGRDNRAMLSAYENCTVRVMKELGKNPDRNFIKYMLSNN